MAAPDGAVGECVPQVNVLVEPGRDELVLGGVGRQRPHLVDVTRHNLLKVEVEGSLEDRVARRAQHQLAAFALRYGAGRTQVLWQLKQKGTQSQHYIRVDVAISSKL